MNTVEVPLFVAIPATVLALIGLVILATAFVAESERSGCQKALAVETCEWAAGSWHDSKTLRALLQQ